MSENDHNYFFGGWPEMPWKKKKEKFAWLKKIIQRIRQLISTKSL